MNHVSISDPIVHALRQPKEAFFRQRKSDYIDSIVLT